MSNNLIAQILIADPRLTRSSLESLDDGELTYIHMRYSKHPEPLTLSTNLDDKPDKIIEILLKDLDV